MKTDNVVQTKSFDFAIKIVEISREMQQKQK